MTHEMCVVIMRRLGQIDDFNSREAVGMKWRKFMDADFAARVVHNKFTILLFTQFLH